VKIRYLAFLLFWLAAPALGAEALVRGFSLSEWDREHVYDAHPDPTATEGKKQTQIVIDKLYDLGVRHIVLSPRARMKNPWDNELETITPPAQWRAERERYRRVIRYLRHKGMTVGLRPIFFVVDNAGKSPYVEVIPTEFSTPMLLAQRSLKNIVAGQVAAGLVTEALAHIDAAIAVLQGRKAARDASRQEDVPGESYLLRRARGVRARVAGLAGLQGAALTAAASSIIAKIALVSHSRDWWHGNIEPTDPNAWFRAFQGYLDTYLLIAKTNKVDEFTLGAELYSMTVGIEDQWDEHPYGFPGYWLNVLKNVRSKLTDVEDPKWKPRIMYDINFTDDKNEGGDLDQFGGEFARWKYRLADLAERGLRPEERPIWQMLVDFWKGLDAIGIDMYRSLASDNAEVPANFKQLTDVLTKRAMTYATQISNALTAIEETPGIGVTKLVILKEIGFKAVEKGFIRPFGWEDESGVLSHDHQAAAYHAIFRAFWEPGWDWFKGVMIWDASVKLDRHGPQMRTFSPIGKPRTEEALRQYFLDRK